MNNVGIRLNALKERLSLNWGELAKHLNLSRAMLDFVRNGDRAPSPKTMRRLMEAERACGIVPPEDCSLPKEKLEKMEYGIPGDPEALKAGLEAIRNDIRSTVRSEMKEIRKELLTEMAALLDHVHGKKGQQ
jgi:transcriptional regulator with XRE-family HTH domain